VRFVEPTVAEGKAKLAEPETIVEHVLRLLGPRSLEGKRVLVIAGATQEPIDDMRVVSNRSSGATGVALAREAWRAGADAELWAAHVEVALPDHVPTKRFGSVEDLLALAPQAKGFDAVLVPAALSDYAPEPREGKVPSDRGDLTLRLKALPKALDELRKHAAGVLVPFKAEARVTEVELVERARASLRKRGAPFVVANLLSQVSAERARVLLVDERSATPVEGTKDEVARAVVERLARERS
jgi:phosphopantothenoylcysteine decarboxylase/phosphopantothenate--cysteine ligase